MEYESETGLIFSLHSYGLLGFFSFLDHIFVV